MHGVIQREVCGVFVLCAIHKAAFVLVPTSVVLGGEMWRNRAFALVGECLWYFG